MRCLCNFRLPLVLVATVLCVTPAVAEESTLVREFLTQHCSDCHDSNVAESGLNLESLAFAFRKADVFEQWVLIHDRVRDGEMPPVDAVAPDQTARQKFLEALGGVLRTADRERIAQHGRAQVRRLNRFEYENTLRAVLDAPWLQVADMLPEDGTAHLFNKVSARLEVSHVQIERYMATARYAIRAAMNAAAHPTTTERFYAREEPVMQRYLRYRFGQMAATRAVIPLLGTTPQPDVVRGELPVTVGETDPETREQEAFGVVSGTYSATLKYDFTRMQIPTDGLYRLRIKSYSFLAGPNGRSGGDDHGLTGGREAWWRPSRTEAFPATRSEPITLYALAESGDSRWLTTYDALPEPQIVERVVALKTNENIRPDAGRLVRTRPGWKGNPNATREGIPGFAMNWLEVEGPLHEAWPPESYQALCGSLPFEVDEDGQVRVQFDDDPDQVRDLLLGFLRRAYRRPVTDAREADVFVGIYERARELGEEPNDALVAALASVLCSPEFLYLEMRPGPLDTTALAARLSYFLWNGPPDETLRNCETLREPAELARQTDRLLDDARSQQFVNAFLDYWLDLRDISANAPDAELYPDYYLDDLLTESSVRETRMFFHDLIARNLSVRNLVDADFAFVNERLANHYDLPVFEGVEPRRIELPDESPRGGLLTQASVLRVTANGTTTSPVVRGAWVRERILGLDVPAPPSGVPAVEPDVRGATTIREQLELHRAVESCGACHIKFDPLGFALESFDIAGGWREKYRATGDIGEPVDGIGKNGHEFRFRLAQPVETRGKLADGREFADIRELKALLLTDQRQLARNLVNQLIVYATGAPVSFADRPIVEAILDRTAEDEYPVRSLIHGVVQSAIFKNQ